MSPHSSGSHIEGQITILPYLVLCFENLLLVFYKYNAFANTLLWLKMNCSYIYKILLIDFLM